MDWVMGVCRSRNVNADNFRFLNIPKLSVLNRQNLNRQIKELRTASESREIKITFTFNSLYK